MEFEELKIYQNRLFVSDLINDVLLNKKTVQEALSLFPKDKNDINIKCAFDALVHREADEDLRNNTPDYKDVQDEYLADLANILKENQKLPENIINEYLKFHSDDILASKEKGFRAFIQYVKRIVNF